MKDLIRKKRKTVGIYGDVTLITS